MSAYWWVDSCSLLSSSRIISVPLHIRLPCDQWLILDWLFIIYWTLWLISVTMRQSRSRRRLMFPPGSSDHFMHFVTKCIKRVIFAFPIPKVMNSTIELFHAVLFCCLSTVLKTQICLCFYHIQYFEKDRRGVNWVKGLLWYSDPCNTTECLFSEHQLVDWQLRGIPWSRALYCKETQFTSV